MKGDFSRSTHRPGNHYSSVRLQQGRVLLDAEWNEQTDIGLHTGRASNGDVIGACGAPKHGPDEFKHFKVAVEPGGQDLRIAPGRIYVDGILCENDAADGVLFTQQGDLPGAARPGPGGAYVVYLDVWERHLTLADQFGDDFPALREVALNGPDAATRTRVVWQVRLAQVDGKDCALFAPPAAPAGRLRAQAVKSQDPGNDCLVPSAGGYRRLENQLYRLEIHATGEGGTVYKWSRDNGFVVSKVKAADAVALTIVVEDEDRDETQGFAGARWVELTDEERILRGEAGALFEVKTVTGTAVTVLNPDNLSIAAGANPTLRRWDGRGVLAANTPVELEDGVQIEFDGGAVGVGDYWLIPARTLTGDVEWPRDDANPPTPVFEAPHGTAHHYCALAAVDFGDGVFAEALDCRELFPPLTAIAASDVSYDPAQCDNLANAKTVQDAIDLLCKSTGGDQPGIHIEKVSLLIGKPLDNDGLVTPADLSRGIVISCDRPLFQDSVRNQNGMPNPVCTVTIDLPWPSNGPDRDLWKVGNFSFVGFQTITLAASVNADNKAIVWVPGANDPIQSQQWLSDVVMVADSVTHGQLPRLLVRLTLKGNFIWGPNAPELYLDGEAYGVPAAKRVDAKLPSGNGRRGGDFEMWFWLARDATPTPGRVGIIPGRLSRFFTTPTGRQAVGLAIDRSSQALAGALPVSYVFATGQPFDPAVASSLAKQTGVQQVSLVALASSDVLGKVISDMLTKNLNIKVTPAPIGDNDLLERIRVMVAARNPPDMVVGNDALALSLAGIGFGDGSMIAL